jgi:hypothetical protein
MKITDLGELQLASSASVRYRPSLELTGPEEWVASELMKVGCTRFQAMDALQTARATPDRCESLLRLAVQSVRQSVFTLPNGVPIWTPVGDFNPDASEPIELQKGFWVFQRRCYRVEDAELVPRSEIVLRMKHAAYRAKRGLLIKKRNSREYGKK